MGRETAPPTQEGVRAWSDPAVRWRLLVVFAALALANLAAWLAGLELFWRQPALLGSALLAYSLGLRHAVDADHIAAIDNVTRKLMQDGQRPVCVGLWFAIGHSIVVTLFVAAIGFAASAFTAQFEAVKDFGAIFGTSVSAAFLLLIGAMNVVVLTSVWRTLGRVRGQGAVAGSDIGPVNGGGVLARLFRPLFGLIGRSWHMLPLGFLFGLGFDTATEIGLLGVSAAELGRGVSAWGIMIFPALFAAGMALIDTADGVLMLGAYDWALANPVRMLSYNLVVTAVSVAVALLIGGIELLGLIGDRFDLGGGFWNGIGAANDNLSNMGFAIILVFIATWGAAVLYGRRRQATPTASSGRRG